MTKAERHAQYRLRVAELATRKAVAMQSRTYSPHAGEGLAIEQAIDELQREARVYGFRVAVTKDRDVSPYDLEEGSTMTTWRGTVEVMP